VSDSGKNQTNQSLPLIAISMLCGICILQLQSTLQGPLWTSSEILMFLPLCLWLFYCLPHKRNLLAFLIGYLWALLFAQLYLQQQLQESLIGQDIVLEGVVRGLPDPGARSVRFDFEVDDYFFIDGESSELLKSSMPSRLRLSWYYFKGEIHSGEKWRLQVRLKPPHGMQNPGGFDYEKWLYQHGVHATGYIRKSAENIKIGESDALISSIREGLLSVLTNLSDSRYEGLLQALTIGNKTAISSEQWQVLRLTGTSHLMAISGLHIGLVAGMVFFMVRRLVPAFMCKYSSAFQIAAVASLIIAGFYALLAGFTVPTQRAFIMLLVMMLAVLLKRPAFSINTLSLALIAVLVMSPVSVLSVGFWLSFLAVIIIAMVSTARVSGPQTRLSAWLQGVRIQWLIALGMLPVGVLLFQQGSVISPVANMLVIPMVGFIIVPLSLLASLMSMISTEISLWMFTNISELFTYVWALLEWFAQAPLSSWQRSSIPYLHSLIALVGALILLMPKGFPMRYSGLILLMPMLIYDYPRPDEREFWVDVLDVGQGLSVLVQTRDKSLLYDTGAKLSTRFDIGERVVVPYLTYIGLQKLDILIVSHADNDHAGGMDSVMRMVNVSQLLTESKLVKEKSRLDKPDKVCAAGQRWQWNGVNFEVLHPESYYKKINNRSCVLKVWNKHYSLIIPGDIESRAEKEVLLKYSERLSTDVLIVPHHGSNTSSSEHWLDMLQPQLSIVSAGYKNRFGHPTYKVLERYKKRGSRVINTANAGMIQLKLPDSSVDGLIDAVEHRKVSTHYWNHRL